MRHFRLFSIFVGFMLLGCVVGLCNLAVAGPTVPQNGYVPDKGTAIRVAEAILLPIYGEKQIASERPFSAQLKDGVWIVTGHLPEGWTGGVAEIKISKGTCQIISVSHGK